MPDAHAAACICEPDCCAGDPGFEEGDPRICRHCAALDGEWPCPADVELTAEALADAVWIVANGKVT